MPLRAYLPEGVPNYVTKEGLAALNEELKKLEAEHAKAGDNYIMSNFIEAKMKLLISRINSAVEVDLSKASKETVSFGAWVRYNGRVVRIVGVDEADISKGLLSFVSPLAKALTGKKAGDVIELKGTERIIVEVVSYEPMALTQMASEKPTPTSLRGRNDRSNPHSSTMDFPPSVEMPLDCRVAPQSSAPRNDEQDKPCQFEPEVNPMQFLPIVNERCNIMGRALYVELHNGNKMLHPAVHLHVINGKGVTTSRYWWHVAFGDTPEKTLLRKMAEVLSLSEVKPKLKRQYLREAKNERELVYVFTVVSEEDLLETPKGKDYTEVFEKD